jgi:predicted site-specific integrase-resolvase
MHRGLTTTEAAEKAHINRVTLQEWIRTGRVKAPRLILHNGRAIRFWSAADIKKLRDLKARTYRRGRGRKKTKA